MRIATGGTARRLAKLPAKPASTPEKLPGKRGTTLESRCGKLETWSAPAAKNSAKPPGLPETARVRPRMRFATRFANKFAPSAKLCARCAGTCAAIGARFTEANLLNALVQDLTAHNRKIHLRFRDFVLRNRQDI